MKRNSARTTILQMRCVVLLAALIALVLALSGCSNQIEVFTTLTPTVQVVSPAAVVLSSTPTASPTVIASSPTSTVTLTPQLTATRRPTLTQTPASTPTVTPTSFPTLDSKAKLDYVIRSLKTNRGCELPCWWGITPGKTKWNEMLNSFAAQGIDSRDEGQLNLGVVDRSAPLDVTFQQENDLVQAIDVKVDSYDTLGHPQYADAWHRYTLDQMLSQYGIPTQVYLELTIGAGDWSPGMKQSYDLWLAYDNKGIAIRYPGELIRDNRGYFVCPVFGNVGGIEIRLQSPNSHTPVVKLEMGYQGYEVNGSLKELTGINPQEFYEMFTQVPPQGCLLVTTPRPWRQDKIILPDEAMVLPAQQEEEYLVNNLASNDDCELPCWWGIKPGETTSQSMQQMFLQLGKSVSLYQDYQLGPEYTTSLFGRHTPYPFDYVVEHRWYADKNGIINLLGVTGYSLNWSPPQHFIQDWQRYSLSQALTRYGLPSKVLLHYWSFGWQYSLALVYEEDRKSTRLNSSHT